MFDTHCHLNFGAYKKTLDQVIDRAFKSGITGMVVPGTDVPRSIKAVSIANKYKNIYAAVGIHPHHVYSLKTISDNSKESVSEIITNSIQAIKDLANNPKVVAIGEIGMDKHTYEKTKYNEYIVDDEFLELQKQLFILQAQLAVESKKSLILHNREATDELLAIIQQFWDSSLEYHTVLHCCEADNRLFSFAKEHKIFIGVDGDITFDATKQSYIQSIPLEMLVIETDAPFLLPEPYKSRKEYPNEPAYIREVVKAIAHAHSTTEDEIIKFTTNNAQQLFQLAH